MELMIIIVILCSFYSVLRDNGRKTEQTNHILEQIRWAQLSPEARADEARAAQAAHAAALARRRLGLWTMGILIGIFSIIWLWLCLQNALHPVS